MSESPWDDVSDRSWRIARTSVRQHAAIQDEHELGQLLDLCAGAKVVLELGTLRGGTFHALAWAAQPDAVCISVDFQTPTPESGGGMIPDYHQLKGMTQPGQEIHQILGDTHSPETLRRVKEALNGRLVDVLFIDADHHYDAVRADHLDYAPLVAPGGIVAFHDINRSSNDQAGCEVDEFWVNLEPYLRGFERWEFVHAPSYGIGAYRVPAA